jgi:uncharacterized protein YkwD
MQKLRLLALTVFLMTVFVVNTSAVKVEVQSELEEINYDHRIIDLINNERESRDLGRLAVCSLLQESAKAKNRHMVKYDYFAHTSPNGTEWYEFIDRSEFVKMGENLAKNFRHDWEKQHQAWMKSEGHRDNILNKNWTCIGLSIMEYNSGEDVVVTHYGY